MASAIGADLTLLYSITFHRVGRHDVCRIAAKPSPKPVYVNGDLYVRDGNSKKKLNAQQALEYVRGRWALNDNYQRIVSQHQPEIDAMSQEQ